MLTRAAIETVLAWHAALNQADVEGLLRLTTVDVEVGGPRGSGRGAEFLRDWVARAGIRLEPGRIFGRGDVVVVAETASWGAADGQSTDSQEVASVFRSADGRVSSVMRYPDLASALQSAGLGDADERLAD